MKTQHKSGLHPRNRHQTPYDFDALCQRTPELLPFVFVNEHGTRTLDFADPAAVKALNRALLALHYGIQQPQRLVMGDMLLRLRCQDVGQQEVGGDVGHSSVFPAGRLQKMSVTDRPAPRPTRAESW